MKRSQLHGSITATDASLYPAVRHNGRTTRGPRTAINVKLDTGSNRTVIPEELVPYPVYDRGPTEPATMADGSKKEMPTTEVFLELPGCRSIRMAVLVSSTRKKERGVLVGHDYMESVDMLLDMSKRTFKCRRDNT